jgi:hypothetical protein
VIGASTSAKRRQRSQKKFNPKWGPGGKKNSSHPIGGQGESGRGAGENAKRKGQSSKQPNGQDIKGDEMELGVSDGVQRTSRRRCAGASSDVELSNMARMLGLQAGQVDSWGALPEWYPDYLPSPPE